MRGIRQKRLMFVLHKQSRRRHPRLYRLAAFGVFAVFAGLLVLSMGWPGASNEPQKAQITLQPQKKLFGVGEQPVLHLRLKASPRISFFQPRVYAEAEPQAVVEYHDRVQSIPAQITPDSAGYTVAIGADEPQAPPKAGSYTVTVTGQTSNGQDFTEKSSFVWGVLGVNTDKSIYASGETAHLQFGVVDSLGKTVCDAPLQVTITDPAGQATTLQPEQSGNCRGDSYVTTPDYTASYSTRDVGEYKIDVRIKDTDYTMSESFKVQANTPFDVARSGLTRLYPTHEYTMQIHVTPQQDFTGKVREVLPDKDFKVTSFSPGAVVDAQRDRVVITWDVQWHAGVSEQIAYNFLPPFRSPAFYQVAPLELINQSGATVFKEGRGWQYVNDAALGFVKETQVSIKSSNAGPPNASGSVAVTSSPNDTLILLFSQDAAGSTNGLGSVSDSAGNTWTLPGPSPNQNPPANFSNSVSSNIGMAYVINASAITSIQVAVTSGGANNTSAFAFNVVEFSNVDQANPIDQSVSASNVSAGSQSTPTITGTMCDQPTTDQLLRGGDYFCTSVNELIIGIMEAGHNTYTLNASTGIPGGAINWSALHEMGMSSGGSPISCAAATSSCAVAAYQIEKVSGSYFINWTLNTINKAAGVGVMSFRQNGNTSGGDERNLFWAH